MSKFIKWDKELLCEEANVPYLAEEIGIEMDKTRSKANKLFCKCFVHGDAKASMQVNEHFVYCYGCGWSGNAIDMVMKYTGKSFQDACQVVAESTGNPNRYITSGVADVSKIFPLTKEELEAINLNPKLTATISIDNLDVYENPITSELEMDKIHQVIGHYGIKELYHEDEYFFWYIVGNKASSQGQILQKLLKDLSTSQGEWVTYMCKDFENNLSLCRSAYYKALNGMKKISSINVA